VKKITEVIIVVMITAAAFYFALNWTIGAIVHKRSEVLVPQLSGKSLSQTMDILYPLKLGLMKEGEEYNSQVPPGTIMRQGPAAGMTVREGKIIKVTLSKGSDLIFVPDVRGQTLKIAEMFLRRNNFEVGGRNMFHSLRFAKDEVMWQSLEPNSIAEKSVTVDLSISLGPPPEGILLMPDFTGKNAASFTEWADKHKLNYEIKETQETGPANTVSSQQPTPDTVITYDLQIKVFIFGAAGQHAQRTLPATDTFHYEVPQGGREVNVKVVLIDAEGEHQIFSGMQAPGSKIDIPLNRRGRARTRVFISNILVEEKEL
jgi:serine/threonine-protein kinase